MTVKNQKKKPIEKNPKKTSSRKKSALTVKEKESKKKSFSKAL